MVQSKFPIVEARPELGFTPTRAVRANLDVRTVDVGAAVGQAAVQLADVAIRQNKRRKQVESARQKMTDANSAVIADGLRDQESLRMAGFKDINPQKSWEAEAIRGAGVLSGEIGKLDGSQDFHENQKARSKAYTGTQSGKAFVDATRKLQKDTTKTQEVSVLGAFSSGNAERIAEATRRYAELGPSMGKSKAEVFNDIKEFQADGEVIRNKNAVKAKKSDAALTPEIVFAQMQAEKELRKAGEGSPEFDVFTNEDLETIADYTKTVGEQNESISTQNTEAAKVGAYDEIRDGAKNIDAIIDAVNADPTISNEDKAKFAEDIPTYFNKWNSTVAAETSDEAAYDTLTQLSEAVERGASSPAAWEDKYIELKDQLDPEDQRTLRSKDIVATKSMQNRAFSDALIIARPSLIELTVGELESFKLAAQNKAALNDIAGVTVFNIAIKKNQAEQWNMGRFRKELRRQISQNDNWSQEQIFVAEEVLTDQLDLPVGELLKAFDEQNPKSSILATPPDDAFKSLWKSLNVDDKARIWELRMRGIPSSLILESE